MTDRLDSNKTLDTSSITKSSSETDLCGRATTSQVSLLSLSFEALGKAVPLLGLTLYAIGLLTSNYASYALGLGVTDFASINARFIFTGLWVIAPLAINYYIIESFLRVGDKLRAEIPSTEEEQSCKRSQSNKNLIALILNPCRYYVLRMISFVSSFLLSIVISILMIIIIFACTVASRDWPSGSPDLNIVFKQFSLFALDAIYLYASALFCSLCLFFIVDFYKHSAGAKTVIRWPATSDLILSTAILPVFWVANVYLGYFAQFVHPVIAQQFGGGRPKLAQIVFTHDAFCYEVKAANIPMQAGPLSKPLKVVLEGNEFYILKLPPDWRVVQVHKDAVRHFVPTRLESTGSLEKQSAKKPSNSPDLKTEAANEACKEK